MLSNKENGLMVLKRIMETPLNTEVHVALRGTGDFIYLIKIFEKGGIWQSAMIVFSSCANDNGANEYRKVMNHKLICDSEERLNAFKHTIITYTEGDSILVGCEYTLGENNLDLIQPYEIEEAEFDVEFEHEDLYKCISVPEGNDDDNAE